MLTQLRISNFAIIEHTELSFSKKFNVITGETGAGKSILLGALSLILGQRADLSSKAKANEKTVIEAQFKLNQIDKSFFKKNDLDFDTETILRRELLHSGKSRAFINDTPVNLNLLKEFGQQLIDIHYQHETMRITDTQFQGYVLDVYAGNIDLRVNYMQSYKDWTGLSAKIEGLKEEERRQQQQKDFIQFQVNELETANLQGAELENIESELDLMKNAEEIGIQKKNIDLLMNQEGGNFDQLREVANSLRTLASSSSSFEEIEARFSSVLIELEDVIQSIDQIKSVELDEERMIELKDRFDIINRLLLKHNQQSETNLIALFDGFKHDLDSLDSMKDEIQQLVQQQENLASNLRDTATELHQKRKSILPSLEAGMVDLLAHVGMDKAVFNASVNRQEEIGPTGFDKIEFLFSANQGREPKSLKQVASGGELSRIMLALTSMIAEKSHLPTLVFDEIDTGISGEVAKKVGELLQKLSKHHQVISITHSPQVAAKGDSHFKVFKFVEDGMTHSKVEQLKEENRVLELAEMLSGQNPSDTSLQTAKELMEP